MPDIKHIDVSRVTHVFVGYSSACLEMVKQGFTAGQVLFLEEPDVIRSRNAVASCSAFPAVAGIVEAPIQDDINYDSITRMIQRPPGVRAVIPGDEYGVVFTAALAREWGTPGAGLKAARTLRDKAALRTLADLAGIRQPAWSTVEGPSAIEEFRRVHGGQCVVKPVDRQGSLGVALIGPDDDIDQAWQEMVSVREPGGLRAREELSRSRYLAEEMVVGAELSVEALIAAGQVLFTNITAKDVLQGRHPVELGHTLPATVPAEIGTDVVEITCRLVKATEFHHGMIHAEWIVVDRVPYLIECAARPPGDRITTLIDLSYGVRIMDALLTIMEGRAMPVIGESRLAASIRYLTAEPGIVTSISGIETAWDMDDVVDISVEADKGSVVNPLKGSMDRIGSVITVSQTAAEARESAIRAVAAIKVTTR